jgi:uroporphyrinogen-III synthase
VTEPGTGTLPLHGRTVGVTAERRFEDQAALLRKRGATVLHAPTMHTVDLTGDAELRRHTEAVIADPPAWTVATTGFGMRLWLEAADSWGSGDALVAALGRGTVVARGAKAQSACRQRGLEVEWKAPSEAMPEVVAWLRERPGISAASVVVQLFDPEDHPSTALLRSIAGAVREVPVYRWRWPEDPAPARELVRRIVARDVDAVTFTSQPAVRFLLEIAAADGREAEVVAAFNDDVLPVCVGPVCAEAGVAAGITTMVWPETYRLAPMVRCAEAHLVDRGTFGT